jgi:hypothetical protein
MFGLKLDLWRWAHVSSGGGRNRCGTRANCRNRRWHPFYRRLNDVLECEGFEWFCEARCREFYHEKLGRLSSLMRA